MYNLIVFLYIVIFKEIEYFFLELKKNFREYDVYGLEGNKMCIFILKLKYIMLIGWMNLNMINLLLIK